MPEPDWERLGVRMLHKVCPVKARHADLAPADGHCPQCGLDSADVDKHLAELR
jgi:hypothetical protein